MTLRKFSRRLLRTFLVIIAILMILYGIIQIPAVQTMLVRKVAATLSENLHTKVTVEKVKLRFFNRLLLENVLVEDRGKDTLIYAGTLKADVTDWFIFKDKIVLKNIGLDNGYINMHRKDSVWNYQFLIDYFVQPKSKDSKKNNVIIDAKELHFQNIIFNKKDEWIGQNMGVYLKKMDVFIDSLNIERKVLAVKSIDLVEPKFSQNTYTGFKPPSPNLKDVLQKIPVVNALKWNKTGFKVDVGNINIIDGDFQNDKFTSRSVFADKFDGQHIHFSNISGTLSSIKFLNDSLNFNIKLKAKERSGLEVKNLEAKAKFTPEIMEFKNLDLQTNNSHLKDYYAMRYKDLGQDFPNFVDNVELEAHFQNGSYVASDDIGFFAPKLRTWNRSIQLKGNAKGTIANFRVVDANIKSGNTLITGDFAMRGLTDIKNTYIELVTPGSYTNYNEIATFAPSIKNIKGVALKDLGTIHYQGKFSGFLDDFILNGEAKTNLGNIAMNLNLKPVPGNPIVYKGHIKTPGFNVGRFANLKDIGIVALDGDVDGQGLNLNDLNTSFKGTVNRIDYQGKTYVNVNIDGTFRKKVFDGSFAVNDPNLQIDKMTGTFDLSKTDISFKVNSSIRYLNLKVFGLTKKDMIISGLFDVNFTGKTIDNFLGRATIQNAKLIADGQTYALNHIELNSYYENGSKTLSLETDPLSAKLVGDFKIKELPDAFKVFLSKYYPTYFRNVAKNVTKQNFTFNIQTHDIEPYIHLIHPRLSNFNNSEINGLLNLNNNDLDFTANVPQFGYDNKVFNNINLQAKGNLDKLQAELNADEIRITDSLVLPKTNIQLTAKNDISDLAIKTTSSKEISDLELNGQVQHLSDGVIVRFFPSSFIVKDKKWNLEKDGELVLRKGIIDANEVRFIQGKQKIILTSEEENNVNFIVTRLDNVIIEDFAPYAFTNPNLKGYLTGKAILRNSFQDPIIEFNGFADSLAINHQLVGKFNIRSNYTNASKLLNFNADVHEEKYDFTIDGFYNPKDSIGNKLVANLNAKKVDLQVIAPYLSNIVSDVRGTTDGKLTLTVGPNYQYLTGNPMLRNASFVVNYTKVKYLLNNEELNFGKNFIDVGQLQLKDTLGNDATAVGRINHQLFKNFGLSNVRLETQKLLLLNTTKKDNSSFYGNVIGRAIMNMSGPVTDMKMDIAGEPSYLDSSHIYLPTGDSKESNPIDYIDFIQFGDVMKPDIRNNQVSNITVNMDLTANPACQIDVILDEETGDILHGQGNGKLNIRVGTTEPLSIRGRYELTKGDYTFNFQTFLKKPFTLTTGSITWNGDPYLAIIDINAEYLAKNVDISSLTLNPGIRQKEDITILSKLTGILKKPDIKFEFKLPEKSEFNRDYIVVNNLASFQRDENNMNKQVASLLLFNSFILENQNFLSQENTFTLATNTIGGLISNWLTGMLNAELQKATRGVVTTYIDINPSLNLQTTANQLQANVRAGVKILLSSRIQVLIGGNIEYNNPYTQIADRNPLTPDITIEWLLNQDGTIRVVGFSRTSYDITNDRRNRSGVQLTYRKSFNKFSELFKSRKKRLHLDALLEDEIKVTPVEENPN